MERAQLRRTSSRCAGLRALESPASGGEIENTIPAESPRRTRWSDCRGKRLYEDSRGGAVALAFPPGSRAYLLYEDSRGRAVALASRPDYRAGHGWIR